MFSVFDFVFSIWNGFINLLNEAIKFRFNVYGGFTVGFFELILGFIFLTMAVGIFWKGAKK